MILGIQLFLYVFFVYHISIIEKFEKGQISMSAFIKINMCFNSFKWAILKSQCYVQQRNIESGVIKLSTTASTQTSSYLLSDYDTGTDNTALTHANIPYTLKRGWYGVVNRALNS